MHAVLQPGAEEWTTRMCPRMYMHITPAAMQNSIFVGINIKLANWGGNSVISGGATNDFLIYDNCRIRKK